MVSPSERFYEELSPVSRFQDVLREEAYRDVPDDWLLVLTDVEGSTRAIEAGRYKAVNALGVGSIVAVRNAIPHVDLPFMFGGDGATLLVPGVCRSAVEPALRGLGRIAKDRFALDLRAGIVEVKALRSLGATLRVARFRASEHAHFAMFGGTGFVLFERLVKDPESAHRYTVPPGDGAVDLRGFECRWQGIRSRRGRILSLLVEATDRDTYGRVLRSIEQLVEDDGCPVSVESLHLAPPTARFDVEARLVGGRPRSFRYRRQQLKARVAALVGRMLFSTGRALAGFDGRRYRAEVVENSDYRKFDETLRMVVDVSPTAADALLNGLDEELQRGHLIYGAHETNEALMTCAIGNYAGNHLHFLDGANGGYALAAKALKLRRRARPHLC